MASTTATLREITHAVALHYGEDPDALYSRARTMRDRGLFGSARETERGKQVEYRDGEIVAAIVAITASLSGESVEVIQSIDLGLRIMGRYDAHFWDIVAGHPLAVRLDTYQTPRKSTNAKLVDLREPQFNNLSPVESGGNTYLKTEVRFIPLHTTVTPVLKWLI